MTRQKGAMSIEGVNEEIQSIYTWTMGDTRCSLGRKVFYALILRAMVVSSILIVLCS